MNHFFKQKTLLAWVSGLCLALSGITLGVQATSVRAEEAAKPTGNQVRPELGKVVNAALELLKGKKGKEALAKIREADGVKDKSAYESFVTDQIRAQSAALAGEPVTAAAAFEAAAASSAVPANQKILFIAAAAGQYYVAKDYAKCADAATRYFKEGGTDKPIRALYVQALYLSNDFAKAAKELQTDIAADEQAGKTPPEDQLQMYANAALKSQDKASYATAMEKLVAYYPKRDYWLAVIYAAKARPGFSDRLDLNLARLKMATGTMSNGPEYFEAAQLSLQAGFPAEAKKIIDQGYAAGLLGTGAEADRHKRLKEMAERDLTKDKASLSSIDNSGRDGGVQVNNGFNLVFHGQTGKGLEMMEQGLRKGGMKRLEDAKLHLGYAYFLSGDKAKALAAFRNVQGNDGTAALAQIWLARVNQMK